MDLTLPSQVSGPSTTANSEASGRMKKDVLGSIKKKLMPTPASPAAPAFRKTMPYTPSPAPQAAPAMSLKMKPSSKTITL